MFTYQINIVPKWQIKNEPNYFISNENNLHNIKNGKKLQMQVKGYTKGYYLSGKFYSLKKLIELLIKTTKTNCPF